MSKKRTMDSGNALIKELAAVVCDATGQQVDAVLPMVRPIAKYLDQEYGGYHIYKRSARADVCVDDIRRDLGMHIPKRVVCRIHGITPYKMYLLLSAEEPAKSAAA